MTYMTFIDYIDLIKPYNEKDKGCAKRVYEELKALAETHHIKIIVPSEVKQ